MTSTQLFKNLYDFYTFSKSLEKKLKTETSTTDWNIKIISQYLFITIEIIEVTKDGKALTFKVQYKLEGNQALLHSLYCHESYNEQEIRALILSEKMKTYVLNNNSASSFTFEDKTVDYLSIADSIAQVAHHYSSGDQYEPSYYSEVVLSAHEILLVQSNHHNARSINHKNDYTMRDLKIRIPLGGKLLKPSFGDESLGEILIQFRDNSTTNNRSCGDRIAEKIKEQKELLTL